MHSILYKKKIQKENLYYIILLKRPLLHVQMGNLVSNKTNVFFAIVNVVVVQDLLKHNALLVTMDITV